MNRTSQTVELERQCEHHVRSNVVVFSSLFFPSSQIVANTVVVFCLHGTTSFDFACLSYYCLRPSHYPSTEKDVEIQKEK